jgi:hypothetical protein
MCDTAAPGGYCTSDCETSSECGVDATCVATSTDNFCASRCDSPGIQSNCRAGYICVGLKDRSDGACFILSSSGSGGGGGSAPPPPPPPKSPTGSSCSGDSQCQTGQCALNGWPGGYCSRFCTSNEQCGTGVCLNDVEAGQMYCVSKCAAPGAQSTCRTGYACYPFAAPRTDGYCEVAQSSGAGGGTGSGGGGGGGAGGGGGSGGGGSIPTRINYKVTGVQGTYSGNGVHIESATRTDTLAMNSCTFTSPGTTATQAAYVGVGDHTYSLNVQGPTVCPPGMATSTAAPACTSQAINVGTTLEWTIEMSGWTDASVVTFKIRYPPVGLPGCNHASVIMNGSNAWGIQGTTTVGKFRAGVAFPVRFVGARMLNISSPWVKSSDVSWDFTMTIQPL